MKRLLSLLFALTALGSWCACAEPPTAATALLGDAEPVFDCVKATDHAATHAPAAAFEA